VTMLLRSSGFLGPKDAPPELYEKTALLDHGYMHLVEHMGHDERIVEAARMSTDKGFVSWDPYTEYTNTDGSRHFREGLHDNGKHFPKGDAGLLSYLYGNKHATPFEMCELCIVVQAPIFCFREWHRHRTQSYNELSARYTPLPDLNYVPTVERLMLNSATNKQAGTIAGAEELTEETAETFRVVLRKQYREQQELYEWALRSGVPKELARVHLPVGRYSRMMAKGNLRNWLAFMTLRSDSKAQWEIRQYSLMIGQYVKALFPKTWDLFQMGKP
jgi:thymidylate synthase (FAD)